MGLIKYFSIYNSLYKDFSKLLTILPLTIIYLLYGVSSC